MNLHCSQTSRQPIRPPRSLFPYEFALLSNGYLRKQHKTSVWFPYEFALLSNLLKFQPFHHHVWFPYEFALLSNVYRRLWDTRHSLIPLRICTALKHNQEHYRFFVVWFPYEFALLSNGVAIAIPPCQFDSPTNLHCSQTSNVWNKWSANHLCNFASCIYSPLY